MTSEDAHCPCKFIRSNDIIVAKGRYLTQFRARVPITLFMPDDKESIIIGCIEHNFSAWILRDKFVTA